MRLTLARILTVASIGLLSVGAYHLHQTQTPSAACAIPVKAQGEQQMACLNASTKPTWYAWLSGESRSAQFHYLDLLELLTRSDNQQTSQFDRKGY